MKHEDDNDCLVLITIEREKTHYIGRTVERNLHEKENKTAATNTKTIALKMKSMFYERNRMCCLNERCSLL
jgi:hypothetical protein